MKVHVGVGKEKDCYVHDNISKVIVKYQPLETVTLVYRDEKTFATYNLFQDKELTFEIEEEKVNEHHHYDADFIRSKYHLDDFPTMYKEQELFKPIF